MKLRFLYGMSLLFVLASSRTALCQQPIITDFNPAAGSAGDTIVITGSGFTGAPITVLFWNNVPASGIFIASDTQITATVPSGITTGPLSIRTSSGSQVFSSADFTAVGPGPYICCVSPNLGAVNDFIAILGVHFTGVSAVKFNGVNAPGFNANSAGTQISVFVPPGATSGPVSVITPAGTNNSPSAFTVIGPGPYISDFSPVVGNAGTTVIITGRFLASATSVTFNGVGAAFSPTSDTQITASAPPNVSTGPITVTTSAGTNSTGTNYFFAPPSISSFLPETGRTGTNVVITGTNFLGATAVSFGGTPCVGLTVLSNTKIQAIVPSGAATGVIRVSAPAGSSFSATAFVVQPTIYGFSPAFGAVGSSITITGANFNVGTPIIRFNGLPAAPPTGVSFSQLTAVVPNGATTGPISVTTTNGSYTNANNFFLPASIVSFAPTNTAPGTRVSIKGQNFIGATNVQFGGVAGTFNVTNNTSLGATVPTNVLTGAIMVTTPAGTTASTGLFYGAPAISGFTPTHGLPGNSVAISGVNFLGTTAVRFNGLAAAIVSISNTRLVTTVPNGAQSGPITVVAPGGTNTSAQPFVLDYTSDLAVSITNSSNPVTVGSNLVFMINVVNNGPYPVPNVLLTNILPASVELTSANMNGTWNLTTNGNVITGSTGTLGVGASATLAIAVLPLSPGNITDTVSITGGNPDPLPANNTASIMTTIQPLALLSIGWTGNQVKISWPVALSNYVLESRSVLASGFSWLGVNTTPTITGNIKSVSETNAGPAKYYRLKK